MADSKNSGLQTVYDIYKLVEKYVCSEMSKYGMKSSYKSILPALARKDGVTQLDIVKATGLKAPTVSTTLRSMELAGFVRREKYENDMRATLVFLTQKGAELDKKMKSTVRKAEKILGNGFNEEELKLLEPLFMRMRKNISEAVGEAI